MIQPLIMFAPIAGLFGMLISLFVFLYIRKQPPGNPLMVQIYESIRQGAMAFLKREYKILFVFIVVVAGLLMLILWAEMMDISMGLGGLKAFVEVH